MRIHSLNAIIVTIYKVASTECLNGGVNAYFMLYEFRHCHNFTGDCVPLQGNSATIGCNIV